MELAEVSVELAGLSVELAGLSVELAGVSVEPSADVGAPVARPPSFLTTSITTARLGAKWAGRPTDDVLTDVTWPAAFVTCSWKKKERPASLSCACRALIG